MRSFSEYLADVFLFAFSVEYAELLEQLLLQCSRPLFALCLPCANLVGPLLQRVGASAYFFFQLFLQSLSFGFLKLTLFYKFLLFFGSKSVALFFFLSCGFRLLHHLFVFSQSMSGIFFGLS